MVEGKSVEEKFTFEAESDQGRVADDDLDGDPVADFLSEVGQAQVHGIWFGLAEGEATDYSDDFRHSTRIHLNG